jgi:hypothetical protein
MTGRGKTASLPAMAAKDIALPLIGHSVNKKASCPVRNRRLFIYETYLHDTL